MSTDGAYLRWRHDEPAGATRATGPTMGMLGRFAQLHDAQPDAILRFAQKWGPLDLCPAHGQPAAHSLREVFDGAHEDPCIPPSMSPHPREPLDGWRMLAREAHSILAITDNLRRGQALPPEDWAPLTARLGAEIDWLPTGRVLVHERKHRVARDAVAYCIDQWLDAADVRVRFTWTDRPKIEIGSPSLYAALATQLALAVGRRQGFAICGYCAVPYIPRRMPSPGQTPCCGDPDCLRAQRTSNMREKRAREAAG